ncbi:MAG: glycerol-3-phosphate 1-O-acyltransferase PlsY [Verrucomicrobia bacterium]|jgi:glycerol-3-phosphate acyltransferase PlsY|nr:glycerol-3-phosphate 1-O-acyltransferase PlsY [Verrucomicrobiota bacterium]OQC66130.1 MAG: Glycerol-3-phosphate acyltransferase [Verrucomicrobia bacterium ADurb.Bin006]MDI9380242.1 glycerol-3-phosphate 1-O-acyltransferase PlsY [Verrucomicrobiota bacterium]NMD21802.1 glycerol-3-phosphate 1-O-acyltransferase PlsY [Verrucomicrobiota bacterium]HNU99657.1 glycerol-3-phosphate 1-O-acyltransferase PlsY [Verrucomicrobiota bacterium]
MSIAWHVAVAVAGYLMGSVPTGYLVARSRDVDIRKAGSGNIGATNVLRVLGKPAGILVLAIDALKGALACWLLPAAAIALAGAEAAPEVEGLRIAAGLAAILGHNYTCWLRFKGGKGIATSAGVLLVWMPAALGLALLVWVLAFLVSGYVSLASVVAAFALPFIVWLTGGSATLIAVAAVLGALAIYKHRSNIQRLRAGTEHRFRRSRTNGAPPA